jgi:hypothetical protein
MLATKSYCKMPPKKSTINNQPALQNLMSREDREMQAFDQMMGLFGSAKDTDKELSLKALDQRERQVVAMESIARNLELLANAYAFGPEAQAMKKPNKILK